MASPREPSMPTKPPGGGRRRASRADETATPPKKPQARKPAKEIRVWKSAPEILEELLPKYEKVRGLPRGRGKDATWRKVYLHVLRHCPNVTVACRVSGVTDGAIRKARESDPDFAAAEKEAIAHGIGLVEASAFKSAVYGDLEPVYHQGILCGTVVKYSDAMRALLLKAHKPEVYRENVKVEHGGKVDHTHMTLEEMKKRMEEARA